MGFVYSFLSGYESALRLGNIRLHDTLRLWPMIRYYQDKKKPVFFGPFFGLKSGFFCVQFDLVFFAKQSEVIFTV